MKKKIKFIVEFEYEPNPEFYPGCKTIEEMVKVDMSNGEDAVGDMMKDAIDRGVAIVRYEIVGGN